jgi:hypothetical protein
MRTRSNLSIRGVDGWRLWKDAGIGRRFTLETASAVNHQRLERFVDAAAAAEFLGRAPRRVLELARSGRLPGYPIGEGRRFTWRFRISELAGAMLRSTGCEGSLVYENDETRYVSKPAERVARSR